MTPRLLARCVWAVLGVVCTCVVWWPLLTCITSVTSIVVGGSQEALNVHAREDEAQKRHFHAVMKQADVLMEQEAAEAQATVGALTDRLATVKERLGSELTQERRLVALVREELPAYQASPTPLPPSQHSPPRLSLPQVREELAIVRRDRDDKARDLRAMQVRVTS